MMRLPDWAYARLARLVASERARRDRETTRRITSRDRALRAWADAARLAHDAGRCVERCPFRHIPS